MYRTHCNAKELREKNLVVFYPSLTRMISLWFRKPSKLNVDVRYPITCYWISAGTWGAFTPPNEIFICPWKKDGGMYSAEELKRVIMHELQHLYFFDETKDMNFTDRENYINQKMREYVYH